MASQVNSVMRGPTDEEWKRHKNTIIEEYQKHPLIEVRSIMKRRYGFDASKRMYDTRFRKWGVTKILKSSEKEILARQIGESVTEARVSEKDLKKILRHIQTQSRRRHSHQAAHEGRLSPGLSSVRHKPTSQYLSGSDMYQPGAEVQGVFDENISSDDSNGVAHFSLTPSPSISDMDSSESPSEYSSWSLPNSSQGSPTRTNRRLETQLEQAFAMSPVPASILSPAARTMEFVLRTISNYYSSKLNEASSGSSTINILRLGSTPASELYWTNIKNGIYFWKIDSTFPDTNRRAFKAFSDAYVLADSVLASEPVDFCRELLATLSPTNTRICPDLRKQILSYVAEKAASRLSPAHPISLLSRALLNDGDCANVSGQALRLMLDLFSNHLGASDEASYKLMTTLIKLTRRAGDLETARDLARSALMHCDGQNQFRSIAVELAHIYTTLGNHEQPLKLRNAVVEQPPRLCDDFTTFSEAPVQYRQDDIAVYCMEDIAEYYVRFGNIQEGIAWLSRAKAIGLRLWGECSSTGHIDDKLNNLLRGSTQGQVVDGKTVFVG